MSDIQGSPVEFEEALELVDLSRDNMLILCGDYVHGYDSYSGQRTYSDRGCTGCRKDNTGGCFFPCHGTDRETTAVYTGCTAK